MKAREENRLKKIVAKTAAACCIWALAIQSGFGGCMAQEDKISDSCLVIGEGEKRIALIKAAQHRQKPVEDFWGQSAWRAAFPKSRAALLYLVLPHASPAAVCAYRVGTSTKLLPEPRYIYRMPNSPRHTYMVVNLKKIGHVIAKNEKGDELFAVDLAKYAEQLRELPLSWDDGPPSAVSFDPVPASFEGEIREAE